MLTGLITPTSGTAQIGGHDITTDMDKCHLLQGVCPQFSVFWEDLNVRQHLEFFARLKGVAAKDEKQHVDKVLVEFGLKPVETRMSNDLSGGMKRRLSIAISIIGDSKSEFFPTFQNKTYLRIFLEKFASWTNL